MCLCLVTNRRRWRKKEFNLLRCAYKNIFPRRRFPSIYHFTSFSFQFSSFNSHLTVTRCCDSPEYISTVWWLAVIVLMLIIFRCLLFALLHFTLLRWYMRHELILRVEKKITISLYKFQHTQGDLCNIQKFLCFVVPSLVIVLFDFNSLKAANTKHTDPHQRATIEFFMYTRERSKKIKSQLLHSSQ